MFMAGYRQGSGDDEAADTIPGEAGHKTYKEDGSINN